MSVSLQKANLWKRISAWMFDMVMCVVFATGCMALFARSINYDFQTQKLEQMYLTHYDNYEAEHPDVNFDITQEEYDALSESEKQAFSNHLLAINNAIAQDEEVQEQQSLIMSLTFLMISVSLLIVFAAWHFIVPLILHDGRTFGKKIFGLAVIRTNGVRVSNPILFIRSILGLYTMETMAPVLFLLMTYFGMGSVGVIAAIMIGVLDIAVMAYTQTHSAIHDLLSDTVVVDYSSQRIFETQADLDAYLEEAQKSNVNQFQNEY